MKSSNTKSCGFCEFVAPHLFLYIPWGLLIGGGIASAAAVSFSLSEGWNRGSAYVIAVGLLLLAFSTALQKVARHLHSH